MLVNSECETVRLINIFYWPVVEVYEGGPADNFQGNSDAREGCAGINGVIASPSLK